MLFSFFLFLHHGCHSLISILLFFLLHSYTLYKQLVMFSADVHHYFDTCMWLGAKRCTCKGLCTSVENKTLLKTVFIWNVVLCTCMNEWIYSTDNFSNPGCGWFQDTVITHWKSAEKWPPKMDIYVQSDFCHFAYKQIASTWRNNHCFVRGKHHFIRII